MLILKLLTARMKINQILYVIFQVSFPLNFASPFSVMTRNSSQNFLADTFYALGKKFSDF